MSLLLLTLGEERFDCGCYKGIHPCIKKHIRWTVEFLADKNNYYKVPDRMNYVTALTYTNYGQLATVTEAQGTPVQRQTIFTYNPNAHTLTNISAAGNIVNNFAYDNVGRIATETYSDGTSNSYSYDNLNQTRTILYPDGRTESITNSTLCPYIVDRITDRANRTTGFTYDALKRLTQRQGPEGTFLYGYDYNSNLASLTDAGNKVTTFGYNLDNRLSSVY